MTVERGQPASVAIVSALPGRLRLKVKQNAGTEPRLALCCERLTRIDRVTDCRVSVGAASLIVHYIADADNAATVRHIVAIVVATEAVFPHLPRIRRRKRSQMVKDRLAASFRVLHEIPGRLRLYVPRLRREPDFARRIHAELGNSHGILDVDVRPDRASVIVSYDPNVHHSSGIMQRIGDMVRLAAATPEGHEEITRAKDIPTDAHGINPLIFPTAAIALTAIPGVPVVISGVALFLASLPIARRALTDLFHRRASVDQLDFSALIVLVLLNQPFTGSLMTWLIGLGDFIRAKTMRSSRRAIGELMSPAGQRAWKQCGAEIRAVPVESLVEGDTVLVYPGDTVPVDGVVLLGNALVDQKILTGESVPVSKEIGDAVYALTTVADGQVAIRVEHIGAETRAGQVARMIEDAPLSDTRVQNYASLLGDRLVIPIFLLAGAVYAITADPLRLAGVLILDFATGIRVSAPTTILSAMIGASRSGLFIKGGRAMERLATVDAIVFDKTGTLTMGTPSVADVHATSDYSEDDVLRLAACAEANLSHPAAKAIVEAAAAKGLAIDPPESMEYVMGLGVDTLVAGERIRAGSRKYMIQCGIDLAACEPLTAEFASMGRSIVCVARGDELIGVITYTDQPRSESADVVQALLDRGVKRIVMLTGDTASSARVVAGNLKITDVIADAFPEQKADVVQKLREEGYTVAVIGDGVNDSPAFTRADVGISLAHGADVAKETADVILLDSNLWGLPRAIDLSRFAMGILKQNINIVVAPTAVGMVGSVLGVSSPIISTVINNGVTVLAGLNALRPIRHAQAKPGPLARSGRRETRVAKAESAAH
jgi:Cu2+-exporting ATPase